MVRIFSYWICFDTISNQVLVDHISSWIFLIGNGFFSRVWNWEFSFCNTATQIESQKTLLVKWGVGAEKGIHIQKINLEFEIWLTNIRFP